MKPEQQRIAIAEACGICTHPKEKRRWIDGGEESNDTEICECGANEVMGGALKPMSRIPDYLNSLDAMHGAILALDAVRSRQFDEILQRLVRANPPENEGRYWHFHCVNATASQRAEAFLRAIGKWTE